MTIANKATATDTRAQQEATYALAHQDRRSLVEIPPSALNGSIIDRFEAQVRRMPEQAVVSSPSGALAYSALNGQANRLAHAIIEHLGPGPGAVGLLIEHDTPMVTALIGALKAGKFYLPLDPSFPVERLSFMLKDSGARLIVTSSRHADLAAQLTAGAVQTLNLETGVDGFPETNPGLSLTSDHYSYLLYTSGSTGAPKGVIENHRDVLHFARVIVNRDRMGPGARLSGLFSFSFSGMAANLYASLLSGSTLVLLDLKKEGVARLPEWVDREGLTHLSLSPMMAQEMLTPLPPEPRFPSLRFVRLGTASVQKRHVELLRQHLHGGCIIQHSYGASEIKHIASYAFAAGTLIPDDPLPLGYEAEDTEVLLLRDDGSKADANEPGEIVIRSPFVCPGYWQRPEITAQRFYGPPNGSPDRFYRTGDLGYKDENGCLFFVGRKDFQVKIRGYLVVPQEVEAAIGRLGGVRECAVVARDAKDGEKYLAAYVVPADGIDFAAASLRRHLAEALPSYLVPSAWVRMDKLPLTPNGKVDRKSLPDPDAVRQQAATAHARPMTELEHAVARAWGDVLQRPPPGPDDEFLDLGGDSLKATRLMARLEATLRVRLPFKEFFDAATVAQQAALVSRFTSTAET